MANAWLGATPGLKAVADKSGKGKGASEAPPPPTPYETASQLNDAANQFDPQAAQRAYNINANPEYGAQATTALYEQIRQTLFPQETAVRNQLNQNVLGQLQSPTGYTPEQQNALDTRRNQAQTELSRVLRERANLGGNLYGGRSFQEEGQATSDLQNQFAIEDINRQDALRQQAIANSQGLLGLLYPQVGIQTPQYQSVVPSADNAYSGAINQQQFAVQQQAAQQAQKNALYSALFSGLGTAAGGYFGGPMGAAAGGQIGGQVGNSFGGGVNYSGAGLSAPNGSQIAQRYVPNIRR